jgi:acetyl-CoA acetyltransferase
MYRKPVTVEQVLASAPVCEPLRLLMLCSPNEGAAAIVLSATPPAQGPAIRIAAAQVRSHLAGNVLGEHTPLSGLVDDGMPTPTEMAARAAYEEAGLGPDELDVVELQDTDAARHILSAEELGLCARGAGGRWVRDGGGEMTSRLPGEPERRPALQGRAARRLGHRPGDRNRLAAPRHVRRPPGRERAASASRTRSGRGANACVMIFRR